MRRSRGFTLIELLVVIAIIGILAAMLFPVFARARESARKTQCLANVKNIAIGVQMYLTDYDRFMNSEQDTAWAQWLVENVKGDSWDGTCPSPHRLNRTNPYLRWPVILDDYIKNRDVWNCSSSRNLISPSRIIPQYTPVWWQYVADNMTEDLNPCNTGSWFPPGWGGAITDSVVAQAGADVEGEAGTFKQGLGVTLQLSSGKSTAAIDDPSKWLVVGDNQGGLDIRTMFTAIYASACCWDLQPDTSNCPCEGDAQKFYSDSTFRKQYAPHLGGVNLGFADGHAKWWPAEAALQAAGSCCSLNPDGSGNYQECVPATDIHGTCGDYFG